MPVIPSRGLSASNVGLSRGGWSGGLQATLLHTLQIFPDEEKFQIQTQQVDLHEFDKTSGLEHYCLNIHQNDIDIKNRVWSWELKARANPPTGDPPWSTSNKSSDLLKVSASSQQQYTIHQSSSELPEPYHAVQSPNFRTLRKYKI